MSDEKISNDDVQFILLKIEKMVRELRGAALGVQTGRGGMNPDYVVEWTTDRLVYIQKIKEILIRLKEFK